MYCSSVLTIKSMTELQELGTLEQPYSKYTIQYTFDLYNTLPSCNRVNTEQHYFNFVPKFSV